MKKLAFLLLMITCIFTISCENKKRTKNAKLTEYRIPNDSTSDSDDWLYYYLLYNERSHIYYYYTSPTPVTNFSTTAWATSQTLPTELTNVQPIGEIEQQLSELPEEIEVEMEESLSELPDEIEVESNSNESDNSSDNGSSGDSGGDSGGGSGGGDGGGDGGGGD